MDELIKAIELSLQNENYWGALYLAVNIPDICGKFEFPNEYHYSRWFEANMPESYWVNRDSVVYLSGQDAFAIRCNLLHDMSTDLARSRVKDTLADRFYFTKRGPHLLKVSDINGDATVRVNLGVRPYTQDLVAAYRAWRSKLEEDEDSEPYQRWLALENEMLSIHATHTSMPGFRFIDNEEV